MPKHRTFLLISQFILLAMLSCVSKEENVIPTYTIEKKNFEDAIDVEGYTDPLDFTTVACPEFIDGKIEYIIEDGAQVEEGDLLCIIDAPELSAYHDQMLTQLEAAHNGLAQMKTNQQLEKAMLEAEVAQIEADKQLAQMDSLELQFLTPSKKKVRELQLRQAEIRRGKVDKRMKTLEVVQRTDLMSAEMQVQNFTRMVERFEGYVKSLRITSPKKGLAIVATTRWTGKKLLVGDNVWERIPIVTIPNLENMKVKMSISEQIFKAINVGDTIRYTFDAMPGNIGWGKLTVKTPAPEEVGENRKVKFFNVEGSLDSVSVMPDPGFTAGCHIILKQVKDTIVVPQIAVFDQDSIKVAYVKKKNDYEMRQVLMGLSSKNEVIISAGLNAKDEVALLRPDKSNIKSTILLPDSLTKKKP